MTTHRKDAERRVAVLASLCRILVFRPLSRDEVEAARPELDDARPEDIADSVHLLVEEGIEIEALKGAVSKLLNLAAPAIGRLSFEASDPFLLSLAFENRAFIAKLDALRPLAARILSPAPPGAAEPSRDDLDALRLCLEEIKAIELHYVKKENILFPYFEARYPRYRCLSLMWALHDDMRRSLSRLVALAAKRPSKLDARELSLLFGRIFFDGHALALREEKILFPIVSSLLEDEEKLALFEESKALGFCLLSAAELAELEALAGVLGRAAAAGRSTVAPRADERRTSSEARGAAPGLALDAGSLPPEMIDRILKDLPVDITFVDAQDRVSYFSNGKERIFPRSPAIIGRDVRNCHPAKSVDKVLAILDAFKSGRADREEFWLETGGRFVRIEYRAIRDKEGAYLGTLEISQDLTAARALEGEKRLASF